MPISAYLKSTDPGRISTISTVVGDKSRRRKLAAPPRATEAQLSLYVWDCSSHDPLGAVVPVILYQLQRGMGWEKLGQALCCPLCWRILVPPEGVELPPPTAPVVGRKASPAQRRALGAGRQIRKGQKSRPKTSRARPAMQPFLDLGEPFSVKDVMEITGMSRTGIRKVILSMLAEGTLVTFSAGGHGVGDRTTYQKAP